MCGIAGFLSTEQISLQETHLVDQMCDAIKHRGPDEYGKWKNPEHNFVFGHRRLSIQDLSTKGNQPMTSSGGRYTIAYNGEIYNFKELKKQINRVKHISWNSESDTEVLIELIEIYGIEQALDKIEGMFAFVLYDAKDNSIYFARDRFGEKPLYYGSLGKYFVFASELVAIERGFGDKLEVCDESVRLLLQYSNVPDPYSIYRGIYKLKPGYFFKINLGKKNTITCEEPRQYWSMEDEIVSAREDIYSCSEKECLEIFKEKFSNSVKARMVSDAPIGSFLSGGYDSTLVTSLMAELSENPIKTFSIGFDDDSVNEAQYAKEIAKILKSDHTEFYLGEKDLLNSLPDVMKTFSEPFADPSQIPTFLLAKLARQDVTVCLSGDAGDEIFSGYNRYIYGAPQWRKFSKLPVGLRKISAKSIRAIAPQSYDNFFEKFPFFARGGLNNKRVGDKLHKFSDTLLANSIEEYFFSVLSKMPAERIDKIMPASDWEKEHLLNRLPELNDDVSTLMFLDSISYLPNNNLVKVDQCSMASSLEVRAPFLDRDVFRYAWGLPDNLKIKNGSGKRIVKELTHQYIPEKIMERPKMGFGVPISDWLKGGLKDWGSESLSEESLGSQPYFDSKMVRKIWSDHLKGKSDNSLFLWNVLSFQSWYKQRH